LVILVSRYVFLSGILTLNTIFVRFPSFRGTVVRANSNRYA